MIVLSLNERGLGNPSKSLSLAKLVEVKNQNVILLEDMMRYGKKLVEGLGKFLKGWDFLTFDANGLSRGCKLLGGRINFFY